MARLRRSLMIVAGTALLSVCATYLHAQEPTDSSVQASPTKAPAPAPAVDASAQASPTPSTPSTSGPSRHIAANTAIVLRLTQSATSATLKNGDTLHATLAAPVKLTSGASLPAGTKADLTVITVIAAGKLESAGDITLQLIRVGSVSVVTDIQEFKGEPGHKDLPDSAPAKGTEAELHAGSTLTFHVQPEPSM